MMNINNFPLSFPVIFRFIAISIVIIIAPNPLLAQDSSTPSSDEIIDQLKGDEGMSFRGLVIVPPEEPISVTTDAQGNSVVTDDQGNTFVTDDQGATVVTDVDGNTIEKDAEGNTIVTDTQGNETVVAPPSIDMNVTFQFNSDELTPEAVHVLNNLGVALTSDQLSDAKFRIAGHTDAVGSSSYNQKLSERRAISVRNYLIQEFDIRFSRLDAIGLGEEKLLLPDQPDNGENRRVQIVNIGS